MNRLTGYEFERLRRKASLLGAKDLEISRRANKKYVVTLPNDEKIHFGDSRYQDVLIHRDLKRRCNYRDRAFKIRDKYGNLNYKDKYSANFLSYNLLW